MDDFLIPVSSTTIKRSEEPEPILKVLSEGHSSETTNVNIDSPEDIPKLLKSQPDLGVVGNVLKYLVSESQKRDGFSLAIPGPTQARIVDTLVTTTILDYWRTLDKARNHKKQLVQCLQNANGVGAITSRLRPLIADCRHKKAVDKKRDPSDQIEDLLDVLQRILIEDRTSSQIWKTIQQHAQNPIQKRLMWKEYVAQVASGRILSLAAEAEGVLKDRKSPRRASWLANGNEYASWLGRNLAILMDENLASEEAVSAVTELCAKALGLGYLDRIMESLINRIVNNGSTEIVEAFLSTMKAYEQRKYFNAFITSLVKQYFGSIIESKEDGPKPSLAISGVATLLHNMIKGNDLLNDHVVTVLTLSSLPALDDSLAARRGVIAAIAQNEDKLHDVFEKSLKLFGDSFYIAHTPILQQEALAQTLAITCGYIQRSQPMFLTMMAKSSYHVTGMSNRIGATSPRARFLGMAIGTAISKIVDKPESQLKFDLEGAEAVEAKWFQRLTEVNDRMGELKDLKPQEQKLQSIPHRGRQQGKQPSQIRPNTKSSKISAVTEKTGPVIMEILDDSTEEDDDLMPYEKPDSDPEDDTDDPTEINRNKPIAPVYIRDLLAGLRDQEDYDRHQLALSTAASLIRRKTDFGSEVTDHIEELASVLVGLNDNFELLGFNEQRQQALIAVILAKPGPMAQWFARAFFSGDYSLMQRTAMLITLGLGARELAGLKDSSAEDLIPATPSFPTKTLPPKYHKIYAADSDSNPVAKIAGNLTKQLLSPIAANAADKLSGPNILKVRTFSSRMEVEKRRSKPIPNALAQIVAENFFFPLTGRWWITTRSSSHSDSIYTSTHLLPAFLQTLALLLNASGPNTLALPTMTREMWELLLSVRGFAGKDKGVLNALLFALLMLLETNENKERLATEQAKELLETQQWVQMVFNELGAGSEEDEKIRVLAAGVVVRCQEVVDKYQRRMVGSMMDY